MAPSKGKMVASPLTREPSPNHYPHLFLSLMDSILFFFILLLRNRMEVTV